MYAQSFCGVPRWYGLYTLTLFDCEFTSDVHPLVSGYGVLQNGHRITNGEIVSDGDSWDSTEVIVELQWIHHNGRWRCEFLLNRRKAFELPPFGQYKLAVALCNGAEMTCVEYAEYEDSVDCLEW